MPSIPNLINYYRDCYEADTRTLTLTNFFSQKVENRFFLSGKDHLLNGELPYFPIDSEYADEIAKELSLYKREKEFYCAAFFVVGQREDALRTQSKVCAPLFLYPAKFIQENGFTYVQVIFEKRIVNINFLNSIKNDNVDDLYEAIHNNISPHLSDYGNIGMLKTLLESKIADINTEDILHYPDLYDEKNLKRILAPAKLQMLNGFLLIPAIGFGLLRRSNSTQGIISELSGMAKQKSYSPPIKYLFNTEVDGKAINFKPGVVPAILSQAQSEILKAVDIYRTTLVIGPPGTGKSFTIGCLALDYLSKGKSILIASKTDQAVDVIYKKIEKDLQIQGVAFRAGRSNYKKELKEQLQNLLSNTRRRPSLKWNEIKMLEVKLKSIKRELFEIEKKFGEQVNNELKCGEYVADKWESKNFLNRFKLSYIKWRNDLQSPHWHLTRLFMSSQEEYVKTAREYINLNFLTSIHRELYNNRAMFKNFLKSVTARTSSQQDLLFENINLINLLKTFPIWLVNMADISDIFPMKTAVFDLAIIDEATQCDVASCLPIIQRAKRVVVVGDPKQLRHTSFLSQSIQKLLQQKNNLYGNLSDSILDYRNTSILDLIDERIDDQKQVCFLDEHYRSKPDIIDFSNKNFYASSLRIMTSIPYKNQTANQFVIEANGVRDKNGVNRVEASLILDVIKKQISDEKLFDENLCQSIGVLSPFRDQVDYIGNLIISEIGLGDIEKHSIRCGTAYSFQGEERDIMLISLAIDGNSHHTAIMHLNKPDVFNVSITRARSKQIIFKSFPDRFDCGHNLSKYLNDIKSFTNTSTPTKSPYKDELINELKNRLEEHDFEYWQEYSVAGLEIDLVFKRNEKFFGIDIIGYPGIYRDALTIEDHKTLVRAGIYIFPLPYTYWKFKEKECFDELLKFSES